jgi:hypothetical protein
VPRIARFKSDQKFSAYRTLEDLCGQVGLDSNRFEKLLADVAASYKADRGRSLVERAFTQNADDAAGPG